MACEDTAGLQGEISWSHGGPVGPGAGLLDPGGFTMPHPD